MLELKKITKNYLSGDETVNALKGVSVTFRKNEFVSILGQSGCGKTTMLNIIGGLDKYSDGDLIINNKSTKDFIDKDWDTYRNHSVGFVFQSYNLIPHQSVLSNVELALTLSGVSKEERRNRAKNALENVGLADQINKKPNQLSGGQMQRVAIARALVNNPDILLADEPTGALDSTTSIQIMDLLKEVAKDRLVIMVTHNPELAKEYSTRIISLLDGNIVDDTNPYKETSVISDIKEKVKYASMSFKTALSLSLNNLMTKKARTFLTSFAGSIGIIGIALILSLSSGVQNYITSVERDTLSSYPITIQDNSMDMTVMMETMMGMNQKETIYDDGKIHSRPMINDILETMSNKMEKNNLEVFKKHIESKDSKFNKHAKAVEYGYDLPINVFNENGVDGLVQVSPNQLMTALGFGKAMEAQNNFMPAGATMPMANEVWNRLPDSETLRNESYNLIGGNWPKNANEVVIAVDKNQQVTDFTLYSLGLMSQDSLVENFEKLQRNEKVDVGEGKAYTKEELLNMKFTLVLNTEFYKEANGVFINMSDDEEYIKNIVSNGEQIKVVGILQPKEGSAIESSEMGGIYYTSDLQKHIMNKVENSNVVKAQKATPEVNVFTGKRFDDKNKFSMSNLTNEQKIFLSSLSQEELTQYMQTVNENANATLETNLSKLGSIDLDKPSSISIYAKSFDDKEAISDLINEYNDSVKADGHEEYVISYNDMVGMMMSSVTTVINMISYVLIAFVSVSLIVSSIMIGIITYISVLERTKEIGILRSIGASKKDISHVFNAETFIVGLISGLLGIGITVALNIPISLIVENLTGISNISSLPIPAALILILISLVLTTVAGLIPSKIAAKKDPVEALRTE